MRKELQVKIVKIFHINIFIDLTKNLDKMIRNFENIVLVKVINKLGNFLINFHSESRNSICQFGNWKLF